MPGECVRQAAADSAVEAGRYLKISAQRAARSGEACRPSIGVGRDKFRLEALHNSSSEVGGRLKGSRGLKASRRARKHIRHGGRHCLREFYNLDSHVYAGGVSSRPLT